MFLTEREIFLSNNPQVILNKYSINELENWFGPLNSNKRNKDEYISELLDNLWTKYKRIDLVKWDPVLDSPFIDYQSQNFVSLADFQNDLDRYSPLSLQRLSYQLKRSIDRWIKSGVPNVESFQKVLDEILERENIILSTEYIVE